MRAAGKDEAVGGEIRRVGEGGSGKGWGWLKVLGSEKVGAKWWGKDR
jgi:hypothetical protein